MKPQQYRQTPVQIAAGLRSVLGFGESVCGKWETEESWLFNTCTEDVQVLPQKHISRMDMRSLGARNRMIETFSYRWFLGFSPTDCDL